MKEIDPDAAAAEAAEKAAGKKSKALKKERKILRREADLHSGLGFATNSGGHTGSGMEEGEQSGDGTDSDGSMFDGISKPSIFAQF